MGQQVAAGEAGRGLKGLIRESTRQWKIWNNLTLTEEQAYNLYVN